MATLLVCVYRSEAMINRENIQIDLIKLDSGERLLRLTDLPSRLALEKPVDSQLSIIRQREHLLGAFEAAMTRAQFGSA